MCVRVGACDRRIPGVLTMLSRSDPTLASIIMKAALATLIERLAMTAYACGGGLVGA